MDMFILYATAVLMGLVAMACSVLCIAWTVPKWRHKLGGVQIDSQAGQAERQHIDGLSGWQAQLGGGIISIGVASCAAAAWYGCLCSLTALIQ